MNWRELLTKLKGMKLDTVNIAGFLGLVGVNLDNVALALPTKAQVAEISAQLQGITDADGLVTAAIVGVLAWYNKGKK